jgi:F0F1-type ATP synthase assembly protein I
MLPAADKILGHAGTVEGIKGGTAAAKVVMKFAALQKTIPSLSALASSQPFGYIASSLATITSFLGLALCVLNIAKKNRFITCLESLKDKKKLGKKDEAFFKTLISKQTNMVSILSEEFVKKHNIQGECFSQLSNDELEMIIQQVKYKRTIDIIAAVITVISIGILIASFITAPPLWLTFVPIILFLIAYIVEKKIDSNGQSSVIDMLTPAFIKDLKNQDILVKYLQFGDLYQWFNNNTAIFAFYLTSEEMELLKKEAKKIDKAIVGNAPNVEELKKEFSKRCKEMLESKTTRDKVETVGTALFLGGAGFMLAPFGLWALAVVIPTIMIGCLLKFKPTLFAPGFREKRS